MSTELHELIDIVDELATIVSNIRSRQMHSSIDRICHEVQPIKDRLAVLKKPTTIKQKPLISRDVQDIISRYCNKRIQF